MSCQLWWHFEVSSCCFILKELSQLLELNFGSRTSSLWALTHPLPLLHLETFQLHLCDFRLWIFFSHESPWKLLTRWTRNNLCLNPKLLTKCWKLGNYFILFLQKLQSLVDLLCFICCFYSFIFAGFLHQRHQMSLFFYSWNVEYFCCRVW